MPRTLPWLKDAEEASPSKPTVKRRRVDPSPPPSSPIVGALRTPNHVRRGTNAQTPRSPSTSPPPAPPVQEFMRSGWDHDDVWRMVTDEFTATAQLFTAHLAHAEYTRQMLLARQRENALGGADAITRPVVGTLSKDGQQKKKAEKQRINVNALLKGRQSEEEEEENIWAGTKLAGLISSPRKRERLSARGLGTGRSNTRAAAGFDRSKPNQRGRPVVQKEKEVKKEVEAEDSTDDDLDAPAPSRALSRPAQKTEPAISPPPPRSRPNADIFKQLNKPKSPSRQNTTSKDRSYTRVSNEPHRPPPELVKRSPSPPAIKSEPDFGFPSIPQPSQTGSSVVARRREARLKREREEREKLNAVNQVEELPTFLF